jgi:hypothetical protein
VTLTKLVVCALAVMVARLPRVRRDVELRPPR